MPTFRSAIPVLLVLATSCDDPAEPRFEFQPETLEGLADQCFRHFVGCRLGGRVLGEAPR